MTASMLLNTLCSFLRKTVEGYAAAQSSSRQYVPPKVFEWDLPFKNPRQTEKVDYPFIVARIAGGEDPEMSANAVLMSRVQIELVFGVYSEGSEASGFVVRDGLYDLINLMEHVRQALQREPLLDNRYRLERPYKWHIPEEQPYPLWVGFAESIWSVHSVADEQNGGLLHGRFEWEP